MEEHSKINFISTFLFSVLSWAKHYSKGDAIVSQNKQGPCPHGVYILGRNTQTLLDREKSYAENKTGLWYRVVGYSRVIV